jgi:autotransporter-associated beta strand protein
MNKEPSFILKQLRRHRRVPTACLCALVSIWQVCQPLQAATYYWDADGSASGNSLDGTGLGGTGSWDTSLLNWWDAASLVPWPAASTDTAVFSGAYPALGLPAVSTVTLSSGVSANQLIFNRSGYTLTGGDLTLAGASAGFYVQMGETVDIATQVLGSDGLVKSGGGVLKLTNGGNNYSGTTSINNGSLVISSMGALGSETSAVTVLSTNTTPQNANLIGFGGGNLVLDGMASGIDFNRDLNLEGRGSWGNSFALTSVGDNILSATVTTAYSPQASTFRTTRLSSANGTLALTGTLAAQGTAGTTFTSLGGTNTAGVGLFSVTGVVTGSGSIEKAGAGTLFWNPSSVSGFTGTLRVSASATGQQSTVRITDATVSGGSIFGANVGTGASGAIDLNGGVLEFRNEGSMNFGALATGKNAYNRAGSTIYTGPAVGGDAINGTTTLGTLQHVISTTGSTATTTFNSRNGYGVTFSSMAMDASTSTSQLTNTLTNNMGGNLTFTGNITLGEGNTASRPRTLAVGGNGNTVFLGSVIAGTDTGKTMTKSGSGSLTIAGVGTTVAGTISINGGAIIATDFRSLNNNAATINIGSTTTAGALIIGGTGTSPTVGGLTTSKVINLAGTTGAASIYANQTGANPVILNADFTASGVGVKTLNLGGSSGADNVIDGKIIDNGGANITSLTKLGAGNWVLADANTYTGTTTISDGILKLKANGASSTVLPAASAITFNATSVYAGGTLEFIGQNSTNNVQNLGVLTPTQGSNTIKLTPGTSGTASLVFSSLGTVGDGSGLDIIGSNASNTVTMTGLATGLASPRIYFNGGNFAYSASGVLRAPVYGTDATFVTAPAGTTFPAGQNNFNITGDISAQATQTVSTVRFDGTRVLTLASGATLTVRTGANNTDGGLLATGGSSLVTGGTSIQAGGSGTLTIRVNGSGDLLTLETPIAAGTGGITKNGDGTLVLAGANNQTGTISINEGTVRLSGSGRLGAASDLVIRQGAVLDLNGVTPGTITNAFNNNGIVTNSSSTAVTFTIGGTGASTGTSYGIIDETNGVINVTKSGTGAQSWLGSSDYTGVTTIGGTGLVTVDTLADGGAASGIGASTSAASNLVFNGSTGGLQYQGNIVIGILNLGSRSATTNRLFTLAGTGATISSSVSNNNAIIWSNTGAIVHGVVGPQALVLGGASTGDNTFNPQITDSGTGANITSLTKSGTGQWNLGNSANSYTGITTVSNGILALNDNGALPGTSPLALGTTTTSGILQMSGTFERSLAASAIAGSGTVTWVGTTGSGGFAAHSTQLTVALGGVSTPSPLAWGVGGFVPSGAPLIFNSASSLADVLFMNSIDLGAAQRTLTVNDNGNTGTDFATISGALSGTGGGIVKNGAGILRLTGDNTYTGVTDINTGTLVTYKLGHSSDDANTPTSVGVSGVTMDNTNAIIIGNASTGGAILQYVGPGEVSDRKIRLNSTTGGAQLHADGTGPLILTNVANDYATPTGAKTLSLRGTSAFGNMITSQLTDDAGGGVLTVTVDGSATWILTNPTNSYTGSTTVSAGALGIGHDTAIPAALVLSNGAIFAHGADRTMANTLTLGNNATSGFVGDYSFTFTGSNILGASANNANLYNNIIDGKSLTFNGGLKADGLTANRTWSVDGSGLTVINGDFTTTSAFGVAISKTGNGTLVLGRSSPLGSNFNQGAANFDLDRGTLSFNQSNAFPAFGAAAPTASADVSTAVYTVSSTDGLQVGQLFTGTNVPVGSRIVSIDGPNQFTANLAPVTTVTSATALTFTASGGLTLSPEILTTDTATVDLNGTTQTVNALTANTDGTVIIDNTSANAASFRFGANNSAVTFGTGIGTYTVQNTGAGALSLVKLGNATATLPSGITLSHKGETASEGGGIFSIGSPVTATTSLRAVGGSTLALTGGIANPDLITSIEVGGGSVLSLLDGAGSEIDSLTSLKLGDTGTGTVTLNLNVGDAATDTITLLAGGTLQLGNTITFNMTDAGLSGSTTYTLLNLEDGGLDAFGLAKLIQGATPGGFTTMTWFVDDNFVKLTTGLLIEGDLYWRGLTDSTWNANANNWSNDKAGSSPASSIPGAGTNVIFAWDNVGTAALTTTLEQNIRVNSLVFESGVTTPASVAINAGAVSTNRLDIAPQDSLDGINMKAGGPAAVSIGANLRLGAGQTWNVVDAASVLTVGGALFGNGSVTKAGAGKATLSLAADPSFNSSSTTTFTVDGGALELLNVGALGTTANGNVAAVNVNSGAAFYLNNATATTAGAPIPNTLTVNGGTISLGGANHFIGPMVTFSGSSTINLADANGLPATATARNLTLNNGFTGSGSLTLNSVSAATGGNQLNGTLTLNQDNSGFTGDWNILRGTIATNNINGLGTGSLITMEAGRIQLAGAVSSTWNFGKALTIASASGNALGEIGATTAYTLSIDGAVTLGSSAGFGEFRGFVGNDAASIILNGGVSLAGNGRITSGGAAGRVVSVPTVISEVNAGTPLRINDETWATTYGIVRLTADNTFSGNLTLARGTLEFNTVSDNTGTTASSLGKGTAIFLEGGTLRFIGSTSQSTNRPVSLSAAATLSANGTDGASITYAAPITVTPTADGTQLTLTGATGSSGIITGGFTQTGTTADVTVSGGSWTLSGTPSAVADDFVVTGTGTVLNLDSTGVVSILSGGAGADLTIRSGAVVNFNALNAVTYTGANYRLFVGQGADGADAVANLNANLESGRFILGERPLTRVGILNGPGTLTVSDVGTSFIELYRGEVNANLASSGVNANSMQKYGSGTVTLRGDNTGLTYTGATIVNEGTLVLDYGLSNTSKIRAGSALDMRGATLKILGNDSAATTQTVASFTMASGGSNSFIDVTAGTSQTATLALGAITRAASAGTLRIILNNAGAAVTTSTANTNGIVGSAAYTTVKDSTGTWFGTNSSGNIVGLASTAENNVTAWTAGSHITDTGSGFSGVLSAAHLSSLRFNAGAGAGVSLSASSVLTIASGGILVTDQVTAGSPGILGGTLGTGVTELIITQDSSRTFAISSRIGVNNAVTKTGPGTLLLSGKNAYTGGTSVQNGILQVSGGNAISDTGAFIMATNRSSRFELLANETIGRLAGGQRATNSDYGVVAIGANTLTLNHAGGNTTYAGVFTGSGRIVMTPASASNLTLTGLSTDFVGTVEVNGGLLQLVTSGQVNASSFTVNGNGMMLIDNNGTTSSQSRILDTTPIILNSAFGGGTNIRGLWIRNADNNSSRVETIGNLVFNSGTSYLTGEANVGTGNARVAISASNFVRNDFATVAVRGRNLGTTTTHNAQFRIGDATNQTNFINAMIGGAGASGATLSIVPWAIGETHDATTNGSANMGNSLVTYVTGAGFRPLSIATEYATYATAGNTNNTRESITADLTGLSGRTLNSLVIHNDSTANSALIVAGAGAGQQLINTSGAFLFTLNPAAAASSTHSVTLNGFDNGLSVGATNEYIFHVVNPTAAANPPVLTATVGSSLVSSANITKSGLGTLVLSATNAAGGGAFRTTLNQGTLEIADLDNIGGSTGGLVFAGGSLRLGAGFADDLSTRTITFLTGGGTLDTNGIDVSLAASLGSGVGGFTKAGLGNLSLNATATYSGTTNINAGTVTVAANNAIGNGGDLNIAGGATLAIGSSNLTQRLVSTSGASPLLTGTGIISASQGFSFNHTGDTQIDAVLAGAGGILKQQANIVTLTGLSTYTGVTEVRAGGLVFNSISNVGGGASALGNPTAVDDAIIRMGLTTAATTLSYNGTGHSSNRLIGMQGTTGGLTVNASGTGALGLGGVRFETPGNKTLTLGGTAAPELINTLGALVEVGGVLTLVKNDPSTWSLTQANTYTGSTSLNDGILRLAAAQTHTSAFNFGSTNAITTAGTLQVNENAQFGNLLVQTNSAVNTNQLVIAAGKTLTLTGTVTLGSTAATSTTLLNASGTGSLVVNNTTGTGNTFLVGNTGTSNVANINFGGLSTMNVSLNTTSGVFMVSSSSGTNLSGYAILGLAANTTISASALTVGGGGTYGGIAGQVNQLKLGTGATVLNVGALNIGTGIRDLGSITFQDTTGTLTVRGVDGTSAVPFNMGTGAATTAVELIGNQNTFDVTGHSADLKFTTVNIGTQNRGADLVNVFSFDTGTLEIGSLTASTKGSNGFTTTTSINIGGGTVTSGAWTLAGTTGAGNAAATANFTGGSITFSGNILRGAATGAGTVTSTVNLSGATLDMGGMTIGSATNPVTFNPQAGSLSGLSELNGGGVPGAFTKTTVGVLTMGNGNTYTGDTSVNEGTLRLANTSGSATGLGALTTVSGTTLSGTGSITPAADKNVTVGGGLSVGNAGDITGSQISLGTSGTGAISVNGALYFDLFSGQDSVAENAATTADRLVVSSGQTFTIGAGATLNLATTIPIDNTWTAGSSWRLFDWSGLTGSEPRVSGTFSNLTDTIGNFANLPDLSPFTLGWDVSQLYTQGLISVVVVPEPGRVLLMMLGLLALFMRRRRAE